VTSTVNHTKPKVTYNGRRMYQRRRAAVFAGRLQVVSQAGMAQFTHKTTLNANIDVVAIC